MTKLSAPVKDLLPLFALIVAILVGGAAMAIGGEAAFKVVMLAGLALFLLLLAGNVVWAACAGIYWAAKNPSEAADKFASGVGGFFNFIGMAVKVLFYLGLFIVSVAVGGVVVLFGWILLFWFAHYCQHRHIRK